MIARILAIIFGTNNARQLRKIQPIVDQINAFEPGISALTDECLQHKTIEFKEQLGQRAKHLMIFCLKLLLLCEKHAKRTLGQRHFDVQLMGGIVLHQGKISEMKTGEGKTLNRNIAIIS